MSSEELGITIVRVEGGRERGLLTSTNSNNSHSSDDRSSNGNGTNTTLTGGLLQTLEPCEMDPNDFEYISAINGNNICMECNSYESQPLWGSVSFGVLFCQNCSGKHRSLGTHISFVRSITMDRWTDRQVKIMKNGGNLKCRTFILKHRYRQQKKEEPQHQHHHHQPQQPQQSQLQQQQENVQIMDSSNSSSTYYSAEQRQENLKIETQSNSSTTIQEEEEYDDVEEQNFANDFQNWISLSMQDKYTGPIAEWYKLVLLSKVDGTDVSTDVMPASIKEASEAAAKPVADWRQRIQGFGSDRNLGSALGQQQQQRNDNQPPPWVQKFIICLVLAFVTMIVWMVIRNLK